MGCEIDDELSLAQHDGLWIACFAAMAGPCEIHICSSPQSEANRLASLALSETRRIERTYSRYRSDNLVHAINTAEGKPVELDEEASRLIRYAHDCYHLSEGLFDITSGVLRKAWRFDGSEAEPDERLIHSLWERVGWEKVRWDERSITMPPGMEIDLGGIGKEYAVDRVAQVLAGETDEPFMVNFGGDLRAVSPRGTSRNWTIGIEDPAREETAVGRIELGNGAVATSGDSRRYCTYKGRRLGHILNPRTGWPVEEAPRSVTVVGATCIEAGFLSTLAMLQGANAEAFLESQGIVFHCIR